MRYIFPPLVDIVSVILIKQSDNNTVVHVADRVRVYGRLPTRVCLSLFVGHFIGHNQIMAWEDRVGLTHAFTNSLSHKCQGKQYILLLCSPIMHNFRIKIYTCTPAQFIQAIYK